MDAAQGILNLVISSWDKLTLPPLYKHELIMNALEIFTLKSLHGFIHVFVSF